MVAAPADAPPGIPLIKAAFARPPARTAFATILHVDLQGYELLAERLPPLELAALLDEYFNLLGNAILEQGGQIEEFAEAHLTAAFGLGDSRHTQITPAVAAAQAMQQQFAALQTSWRKRTGLNTALRIGLHRGEFAVGFYGPAHQTAAALIGDSINIAAQLCRRARAGEILMSASVYYPHRCAAEAGGHGDGVQWLHLPNLRFRERKFSLDAWCLRLDSRHRADYHGEGGRPS